MNALILSGLMLLHISLFGASRSPFRIKPDWMPCVTIAYEDDPSKKIIIQDSHIGPYPLFAFNTKDLHEDLLPHEHISFREDPTHSISGEVLDWLINDLVIELKTKRKKVKRKKLKNFIVLQHKNFSYKRCCGLLVLKFKEYPFVLKLFIEEPKTLLNPYLTGLEPIFFYYMGGGANRHLSGLTRIKNVKRISHQLAQLPRWADHVSLPRKWFWLPTEQRDIKISGKNIGGKETMETVLPSTYAIVADAIPVDKEIPIPTDKKKKMVMQLCNDLDVYVDPHFNNFIFLEDKVRKKFKIVIIDTEHFPTMVGLNESKNFRNHTSWYLYLAAKCFHDMYLQSKDDLIKAQTCERKCLLDHPVRLERPNCIL